MLLGSASNMVRLGRSSIVDLWDFQKNNDPVLGQSLVFFLPMTNDCLHIGHVFRMNVYIYPIWFGMGSFRISDPLRSLVENHF
jgi:hypothetical protein